MTTHEARREMQRAAVMQLMVTIIELVQAHKYGMPSGELYAHLMGTVSLENYDLMIRHLIKTGHLKQSNHLLTYTGVPHAN